MPRKAPAFGNGLGMALDQETFSLEKALDSVRNDNEVLADAQRDLIRACLPNVNKAKQPRDENDLDQLQRVPVACDQLNAVKFDDDRHWLSDHGQGFPGAIRKFVHKVACRFHDTGFEPPETFTKPLCKFVKEPNLT